MAAKPLPSQELLRQLLDYDPDTGVLIWRWREEAPRQWNSRYAGAPAFTKVIARKGYRAGQIFKTDYLAHRVIWKWWHGTDPETIDHLNGDKLDNRITNLRSVPMAINAKNRPMASKNRVGEMNIRVTKYGRYRVTINVAGRDRSFGSFATLSEAIAARDAGWAAHGYHQNHGRKE